MRDSMYDDTTARLTLPIAARTTNTTVNGSTVDLQGTANFFRSAMLIGISAAITDGTHTVVLQESDDATAWTNVAAGDLQGTLTAFTTGNQNALQRQAYLGGKRYLRANVTSATVTTGGTVGAIILLAQGSGVNAVT